ncbi:MAG TPA: aspartate carbamoyltransferase catalytic subunit [Ignavibacteria bacterium]|nr:aspartate carbamoyltransferase catalytic subunit [Ignavibacteria bacterium]HQY50820.1 aspartate carbamoyltransferase catalytic subunit [Ignavibacteria bacterium]
MNFPSHLLGLRNLDSDQFKNIFSSTDLYLKFIKEKKSLKKDLTGKSVLNLFFENSTRTRISFELAEKKVGLDSVNFNSDNSSISKGESLLDTIKNIEAMKFDFIVVRHNTPGIPLFLTKNTSAKILNAGDGINEHPTQGLLDIYTLQKVYGDLKGLNVCIVGNVSHSRVALSNIFGLKTLGANVSVCGPKSFIPVNIEGLGVKVYFDIDKAVKENDILNILRVQMERDAGSSLTSVKEFHKYFGITSERIKLNKKIKILHPGPMNINVEIDSDVAESENSLIFDQVTNGLAIKCALFNLMK